MTTAIENLQSYRATHFLGNDGEVRPGIPAEFNEACVPGVHCIYQGDVDLYLEEPNVPEGFTLRTSGDPQIVPGHSKGSRHRIVDLATCDIYDPPGWGERYEGLVGPFIIAKEQTVLDHPEHASVTWQAGQAVQCMFPRVWEHEQKRERRARD